MELNNPNEVVEIRVHMIPNRTWKLTLWYVLPFAGRQKGEMTWHVWQVDELLLGLFELSKFVWYRGMKKTGPCSYLVYPINPNLLFVQCSKLCSSNNFIFFLIPSICTYDQTISFVWGWSQLIIFALPKHFSTKKLENAGIWKCYCWIQSLIEIAKGKKKKNWNQYPPNKAYKVHDD